MYSFRIYEKISPGNKESRTSLEGLDIKFIIQNPQPLKVHFFSVEIYIYIEQNSISFDIG